MKLVLKRVENGNGLGLFGLHTEDGVLLPEQTKTELISKAGEIAVLRVEFHVFPGGDIIVEGD